MKVHFPGFLLAGLKGGSGKTLISLGLGKNLKDKGFRVKAFKKGPDYIDARWLGLAVQNRASNLDPFLFSKEKVKELFYSFAYDFDFALVEGNRGLYDGKDVQGTFSSAELAKLLNLPVILVVDCTKITRTMAAIVLGLSQFDPEVKIKGVILNKTFGERHRTIVRQSIEYYTDIKVIGALPKLKNPIPERHMGLISDQEYGSSLEQTFEKLAKVCAENIDLKEVLQIAKNTPPVLLEKNDIPRQNCGEKKVRIGVVLDAAFWFYYPENLHALEQAGARLEFLSLLDHGQWPELHGLYLGGGFPETLAQKLYENVKKRQLVFDLVQNGLPVYAECGGFMFLAKSVSFNEKNYDMCGVFPYRIGVQKKPRGHGYVHGEIVAPNPFFPVGYKLKGHEFHYSCLLDEVKNKSFALKLERGVGICNGLDGLLYKNVFASYTHIHALGAPEWAENFVRSAWEYKRLQSL
ncbi:MAG: cobyrinate a,c-diamide synthase [Desulfonauticus sp.]|nr:cobyrinate a,c-diamide synthase [Desulfonauticus sp.]